MNATTPKTLRQDLGSCSFINTIEGLPYSRTEIQRPIEAQWQTRKHPDSNNYEPHGEEDERVRYHQRDNSADAILFVVSLRIGHNQCKVAHHRRDNIRNRVTDTERSLRQSRVEVEQHKHRNKHRSEDCPLSRRTAHEDVEECREEYEADDEWQACKSYTLEELRPIDGKDKAKVAVVEPIDELCGKEYQDDVGRQAFHRCSHMLDDIFIALDCADYDTIDQARNEE